MNRTIIKKDELGYYVIAGGWIARSFFGTCFQEGDRVKAHHFGGSTNAAILRCDTTVDIFPYKKMLHIKMNGEQHHDVFRIPVSWDIEKYKKIYDSLKKTGIDLIAIYNPVEVYPDLFRVEDTNFDSMDKDELLKFIKSGKAFTPDNKKYFNSDLFKLEYVRYPRFMAMDFKAYETQRYRTPDLAPIFFKGEIDYDQLFSFNKEVIQYVLDISKYDHLYKFTCWNVQLTKELTAYKLDILGAAVNKIRNRQKKLVSL